MKTLTRPHLSDLMNHDELLATIEAGYVREQTHPTLPLCILNYTQKAQYDRVWTPVTTQCRGLIIDQDGYVVARPFPKFFNYGEFDQPLPLDTPAVVADKLDGSLGILYPTRNGNYAIATRGSFTSAQAQHATRAWIGNYDSVKVGPGYTYLFEIIYPGNRIVCDYGDMDDIVLLGAVANATGRFDTADCFDWPGRTATTFEYSTLRQALTAPPRPGAEGFVVHLPALNLMCKIKQDDYVELHRVLTGCSARTLWEYLAANACQSLITKPKLWASRLGLDPARAGHIRAAGPDWLTQLIEGVPDEFHAWARQTITTIRANVADLVAELHDTVQQLRATYGDDRKAMAAAIADHPHSGALFLLYDGRSITTYAWRAAYPTADKPWGARSEDVA